MSVTLLRLQGGGRGGDGLSVPNAEQPDLVEPFELPGIGRRRAAVTARLP